MNAADPYVYPGTTVLRNKLGITNAAQFNLIERRLFTVRLAQDLPLGAFDLDHLRAIHRHLFQDLFDWAGELRIVEIAKGGHQFQFRRYISTGMADVHRRLEQSDRLRNLNRAAFAKMAGEIMGDLNYVHPFREGNGRTQLIYLEQLAAQAGHPLDIGKIDPARWIIGSQAAHHGNYEPMANEIERAIRSPRPSA